jgi:glutamate 5-kinase
VSDVHDRAALMAGVKRVVLKLGTRMLTHGPYTLDTAALARLALDIADLRRSGHEIVIVSSGAIAAGMGRMEVTSRPRSIPRLQALASIGQNLLMNAYESALGAHDIPVAQVLLTIDDLHSRKRYVNAQNTLDELIRMGVVPVVNENDAVGTEEVTVGDNDNLSAYVAGITGADLLVLFTDVDGLYDAHPDSGSGHGTVIPMVERITPEIEALCGDPGDIAAVGGMRTKIAAAGRILTAGGMMVIANGRSHKLSDILDGEQAGTLFTSTETGLTSRRNWIATTAQVRGSLTVDSGAVTAIEKRNSSLLPTGVTAVEGVFDIGDVVAVRDPGGNEIARGVAQYAAADVIRIMGCHSDGIDDILGFSNGATIIHRDDLVHTRSEGAA